MITPENIIRHELIGLETSIAESSDLQIMGLQGKIVDESKFMLTIETENGIKNIPKENSRWKFDLDGKLAFVNGNAITKRPFERIGIKK
jgi:ribonuclease P protein subunit POP4